VSLDHGCDKVPVTQQLLPTHRCSAKTTDVGKYLQNFGAYSEQHKVSLIFFDDKIPMNIGRPEAKIAAKNLIDLIDANLFQPLLKRKKPLPWVVIDNCYPQNDVYDDFTNAAHRLANLNHVTRDHIGFSFSYTQSASTAAKYFTAWGISRAWWGWGANVGSLDIACVDSSQYSNRGGDAQKCLSSTNAGVAMLGTAPFKKILTWTYSGEANSFIGLTDQTALQELIDAFESGIQAPIVNFPKKIVKWISTSDKYRLAGISDNPFV